MNTKSLKHSLMLGLIYPAVLGTIIYRLFDFVASNLCSFLDRAVGWPLLTKLALLATVLAFYFCDYLYTVYTKNESFGWLFFTFDLIFLICLYATVKALHLDDGAKAPNFCAVAVCYLVFMALYFVWDCLESKVAKEIEKPLYREVIRWEILSVVLLSLWVSLALWWPSKATAWLVVLLLVGMTAWFIRIVVKKGRLFRALGKNRDSTAGPAIP